MKKLLLPLLLLAGLGSLALQQFGLHGNVLRFRCRLMSMNHATSPKLLPN